jgi:DNA-binding GntR family transcriptional regulator
MISQFDKLQKFPSIVDAVVDRLDKAILTGELPLGARLSEQSLAEGLGVSRGPLREALRRLEGRRLIVRVHNLGARVASFTKEDISQLLVIREALEGVAARCAAERMADDEIKALEVLVTTRPQGVQKKPQNFAEYHQSLDHDFHYRIIQGSRNSRLMDILLKDTFYLLRIYRYRFKLVDSPPRALQASIEHQAILSAISAHDPEAAENAMRQHLRNANAQTMLNFDSLLEASENQNSGPYSDRRNGRQSGKIASGSI